MRVPTALAILAIPIAAAAQANGPGLSVFSSIKPQLFVDIKPAPSTTAQLVVITMGDEHYPSKLLETQVTKLCALLSSAPRGLEVATSPMEGTNIQFVRAKFATDGLILPNGGGLQIEPILKAFAGDQGKNTISQFDIVFEEINPTNDTIEKYSLPGVLRSEARFSPDPAGIEYRVQLETQDPDKIFFPKSKLDMPPVAPPPAPAPPPSKTPIIVLVCISGVALAALVYLAFLRWGLRGPSRKVPKH